MTIYYANKDFCMWCQSLSALVGHDAAAKCICKAPCLNAKCPMTVTDPYSDPNYCEPVPSFKREDGSMNIKEISCE